MNKPVSQPLLVLDAYPRTTEMIYDAQMQSDLAALGHVEAHWDSPAPDDWIDSLLPETVILVGQTRMDAERLQRAPKLRAIINVLANWRPNIDYPRAHSLGIHVLSAAPAMAPAVAEWTLGALLDLQRGITIADRKFRNGQEHYGIAGCRDSRTLRNATVGLIGFGNLGQSLLPLLRPFECSVKVYDPWLSANYLASCGIEAWPLERLLGQCDCIAILAGATTENQGFLDRDRLSMIALDTAVVLVSRAAVVDFDALVQLASAGKFRLAVDVYPEEPVATTSTWRTNEAILWSSHIAGADPSSYALMRAMVLDDITQILAGYQPQRLQPAISDRAAIMNSI